jgi:hypothetical protein
MASDDRDDAKRIKQLEEALRDVLLAIRLAEPSGEVNTSHWAYQRAKDLLDK